MAKLDRRYIITTGDVDGVGLEVSLKALIKTGVKKNSQFFVFRSPKTHPSLIKYEKKLKKIFKVVSVNSLPGGAQRKFNPNDLVLIHSDESPAKWVEQAGTACLNKYFSALITAPLSKEEIVRSGLNFIGHTEILKSLSRTPIVYMGFVGKFFNVVLATGHIPIQQVSAKLSSDILADAVAAANQLRLELSSRLAKKPIALVGLNPHAGENGIIGNEETAIFSTAIKSCRQKGINLVGPLVPDAAFLKPNWPKFSVLVSPYHDQGLIPFKLVHGQESGVHISLGLPFVRTSVDHGTAKDIFGKDRAIANSMYEAILWAQRLTNKDR